MARNSLEFASRGAIPIDAAVLSRQSEASNIGSIMAIRFQCPSCHKPIEIEDAWAGRSVACCYCEQVLEAPHESTWAPDETSHASPVVTESFDVQRERFARPHEVRTATTGDEETLASTSSGGWALTLSLAGFVLATMGWLVWMGNLGAKLMERVGPDATQTEQMQAAQEMIASGEASLLPPTAVVMFLAGLVCAALGLILAIRVLLTARAGRGLAIAACILGATVSFCQVLPLLSALAAQSMMNGP